MIELLSILQNDFYVYYQQLLSEDAKALWTAENARQKCSLFSFSAVGISLGLWHVHKIEQ